MPLLKDLINLIINKFWPWFVKYIWPLIKDYVIEVLKTIFSQLAERIKNIFSEKGIQAAASAEENAAAAQAKAATASSGTEKDKWEAIAAVWRDAANMFREENDQLKRKLEEAISEAQDKSKEQIQGLDVSIKSMSGTPMLTVGNHSTPLPIPEGGGPN